MTETPGNIDRRLPAGDEIFLDHVGHFVADPDSAAHEFERAIALDPSLPGPWYNMAILERWYRLDRAAAVPCPRRRKRECADDERRELLRIREARWLHRGDSSL